ncbi:chromosome segregation ATPase [Vibrio sp. JCM 19053]|nr:chromosome segregation ATPase [Vibrio sp. JCM 19053]
MLDDLADEFGHKEAGEELKAARKRVRDMVKDGYAGACDYAEVHRKTYAIHFAVDAFNGKVDSALSKVKHDNYGKIKQEIIDAFALVNHNGAPFRNARINQEYLDARLNELKWAVATFELKKNRKRRASRNQSANSRRRASYSRNGKGS